MKPNSEQSVDFLQGMLQATLSSPECSQKELQALVELLLEQGLSHMEVQSFYEGQLWRRQRMRSPAPSFESLLGS
jgi:hypothetical protein